MLSPIEPPRLALVPRNGWRGSYTPAMRDDPMILGIVAMVGVVAVIGLAVLAFLIVTPHSQRPPFPAQNVDCAVPLVKEADGKSFHCPQFMP